MTIGDDLRAHPAGAPAQDPAGSRDEGSPWPHPLLVAHQDAPPGTGLILLPRAGALPAVWAGPVPAAGLDPRDAAALLAAVRPCTLLPEHAEGWFGRPGLSGHRLDPDGPVPAGRDWSPQFRLVRSDHDGIRARIEAADMTADLHLVTEIEAVAGGAVRARHTVTNTGSQPYVVDSLEVVFPLPARVGEILDFTGRQTAGAARIPWCARVRPVLAPDRPAHAAIAALCHRLVRSLRNRMGPDRGRRR